MQEHFDSKYLSIIKRDLANIKHQEFYFLNEGRGMVYFGQI